MKTQSIKSYARDMLSSVSNPIEVYRLPNDETRMMMPNALVTMDRLDGSTSDHVIMFMTSRIADIVIDVQEEMDWAKNWEILNAYFHNPKTRVAAGKRFEKMFLKKYQKDPSRMPPCQAF